MKRMHLSPALVVSLIALFVALGGTSYAAITALPSNSVGTAQISQTAFTHEVPCNGADDSPAVTRRPLGWPREAPTDWLRLNTGGVRSRSS
jgi:hypothetical protein